MGELFWIGMMAGCALGLGSGACIGVFLLLFRIFEVENRHRRLMESLRDLGIRVSDMKPNGKDQG